MRTIIFDFDGTIADSFTTLLDVFYEITNTKIPMTPERIEQLRSMQVREILKELKVRRWQIPRLLLKGRKSLSSKMEQVQPIDGLLQALDRLAADGFSMIILSTNSAPNINQFLKKYKLDSYFSSVHGGVGIFNKAAAIKKLVKKERLNLTDCIYIGDEVRDIEAARKAGIKYISVAWGFNTEAALQKMKPMKLVAMPAELPRAVNEIFKT